MISLIYGGITHHYIAPKLNYCSKINNVGSIHNEYVIGMIGTKDLKLGLIAGKDSACGNITGALSSLSLSENVDFLVGGYNTNFKKFEERGMIPPSIGNMTPIFGLDFKVPLYKSDKYQINLDNLVSIGIITHAVSLNF